MLALRFWPGNQLEVWVAARCLRVQWIRIRRAKLSRFRNPHPTPLDLFEQPVVALGAGVGDSGGHEGVDLGPPVVDGPVAVIVDGQRGDQQPPQR